MMRTATRVTAAAAALLLSLVACAADWPQWRGPDRNGISPETGLLKTWPKAGPPLAWTFADAITMVAEIYRAAGLLMQEAGKLAGVADEGGWWPQFASN